MPNRRLVGQLSALALLLHLLLPAGTTAIRAGNEVRQTGESKLSQAREAARHASRVNGQVALIVVLRDEPLATYRGTIQGLAATNIAAAPENRVQGKLNVESKRSRAYLAYLSRQQEKFAARLLTLIPDATIHWRYQTVLNGMAITIPPDRVEALASMPEVTEIAPVVPLQLHSTRVVPARPLDTSNDLMGAEELWNAVGGGDRAGLGIKIGIIDTGVDFSNPMFQDPSLTPPPGFPRGNTSEQLANSKVIVADVFQSILDKVPGVDPRHKTAQDLIGHGSHTASCAAGARVDLSNIPGARPVAISGVAPKAFIGSYRVVAPTGGTDALVAGIDKAVKDGMDVINISLGLPGTGVGLVLNQLDRAANDAVAAGVVVCAAAGNEGPPTSENQNAAGGTIASPGNASRVLTVGASTNAHQGAPISALSELRVDNPPPPPEIKSILGMKGIDSASPFPETPISAPLIDVDLVDNGAADGGGLACAALPAGSLSGAIALIQRGDCYFSDKVNNAAAAGAIAVVFYNSAAGGDTFITPGLQGAPLPAILIQRSKGLALKDFIDANASGGKPTQVTLANYSSGDGSEVLTLPLPPDLLHGSSSRGPARNFGIKPDVVTVGAGSYAAVQDDDPRGEARFPVPPSIAENLPQAVYDPSGFAFESGTSAASPRAAGVAALLRQLHRDWTADEIKSAIMTTAKRPTEGSDIGSLRVMDRGSGLINMAALAQVKTTIDPPSHSFGEVKKAATLSQTFTLKNHSDKPTTYQISFTMTFTDPAISVSLDKTTLTVGAQSTGKFTLRLTIGAAVAGGTNDWEGFISITDGGATIPESLYIPFWVRTVR